MLHFSKWKQLGILLAVLISIIVALPNVLPAAYQDKLFICDWTYGRLIAVHLTPKGAGYTGSWENFVAPQSLQEEQPALYELFVGYFGQDPASFD